MTALSIAEGAGVLLSIFLIIYLIRRGWRMYWVLLLAIMVLALTNGNTFFDNIGLFYQSLTSYTSFYLVTMVITITLLGHLHQQVGAMQQLVNSLRRIIRDPRILLMVFPAAVSLISTVPGGAIISAPMVEETGKELNMSPVELAMSNIIYRHLIVLITPFNPALVIASGITGISIAGYLSFTIPVIVVVFIIATVILYTRHPRLNKKSTLVEKNEIGRALFTLLITVLPYLLAIILGLAFGVFFPLALLSGIAVCFLINLPKGFKAAAIQERLVIILRGFNWPLIISTLAIVIYKDFMLEAESFLQAVSYLIDRGLPLVVVIVALPFVTGFITGNTAASLGIALPLLIPFLDPTMVSVRYFGIIYISSYSGYLGSPAHLCTYLTNEYFKTSLYSLIKNINIYGAIMLLVGLVLALFY